MSSLIATFFLLFTLLSLTAGCHQCVHKTSVAHYPVPENLKAGACGYGSMAPMFNRGLLAAANSTIFKSGEGCGACFHIKCKENSICSPMGTTVFLFDLTESIQSGFVLSRNAFRAMAAKGKSQELIQRQIVPVEYNRVECRFFGKKNLTIGVDENSRNPEYLAIKFLFQGGRTEITAVNIAKTNSSKWDFMRRNNGSVWETTSRVPKGALQLMVVVTAGYDGKTIWIKKALPCNWIPGFQYETDTQITDVAADGCPLREI